MPQSAVARAVLLVDDDPLPGDVQTAALEPASFEVTPSRSADEALAALKTRRFSAVVSDVRLPGISGIRPYERAFERFRMAAEHWRVYMARDDPHVRELVARRRIPALRKPSRPQELETFVRRLVRDELPRVRT